MPTPLTPVAITAYTQTNALGYGCEASLAALLSERSGLGQCDLPTVVIDTWIGSVDALDTHKLPSDLIRYDCRNNRLANAALSEDGFTGHVDAAKERHGAHRVGLFIGTSTSGLKHTESCYRRHFAEGTTELDEDLRYPFTHTLAALAEFCRARLGLLGPAAVVSTACSSSAKVFATAHRHLRAGLCDAAVVGGVDTLCATTVHGFNALDLISPRPCRPWALGRDGINIGEGAGFVLLESGPPRGGGLSLLGYGESSDAYHISTPHPQGEGAFRAMRDALARAGLQASEIDYINLHGTATPTNDRTENTAVTRLFGTSVKASSTKGWTGHTLGAAGVTEAVFCLQCLRHGFLPGTLNTDIRDPALDLPVLHATQHAAPRRVMTNSFGFGGSNCSLVFGVDP